MESVYMYAADYGTINNRLSLNKPYVDVFFASFSFPLSRNITVHFAHAKYKIIL